MMFERRRNIITISIVAGLILAALTGVAILTGQPAPSPTMTMPSTTTMTASPTAASKLTAQPPQPTQTAYPTPPPPIATPAPSPTPSAPPAPAANRSKLGVHGIWSNHIIEFTQTLVNAGAPFRIVKAVDDLGWLQDVKHISPTTVTVGRLTQQHEGAALVNDPGTDLDWYAAMLMEPILTKIQDDPALKQAVDYWELTNEPLGGGVPADAYARLAQLTLISLDIAEANDLKLAIFGFNAGTPEWADLLAIVETGVFARARAGGHILSLHEGVFGEDPIDKWWNAHSVDENGNPTTQDTGNSAPGGWLPGGPVLDGAGALCLRYRFLYHLLQERDEVLPLFVSEFYAGGGYDPAHKSDVVARVQWYDAQLAADDYVLGFAPFTLGPTSGWTSHDYEPFYQGEDGLVAYMIAGATE